MTFFNRSFQPSLLMSLITLAGTVLFTSLGIWQLERAAFKQNIVDTFEARLSADYQPLGKSTDWQEILYQRVILNGRYDTERTLLLDNQLDQGRAGYHVLSSFQLNDGDWVLVNRGWIAAGTSRTSLPSILPAPRPTAIKGIVSQPGEGFRMGRIALNDTWPQVIPHIDFADLQPTYENRLLPIVIWLGAEQPGLYKRDWRPVWLPAEKSRAYAVQWFLFAVIALVLFFVLNLRKLND